MKFMQDIVLIGVVAHKTSFVWFKWTIQVTGRKKYIFHFILYLAYCSYTILAYSLSIFRVIFWVV